MTLSDKELSIIETCLKRGNTVEIKRISNATQIIEIERHKRSEEKQVK